MRRLAQAPPIPFIDGRKSVASRPHQYACNDRGGRNPKVRQTAFVCHWQLSLRFIHSSGCQVGTKGGTPGRTFPSASMPASGPRHARGPSPSPIRPSKRPLPIHSFRCATYTIVVTVASPVTTRVLPRASCRTVPSAWADGPMPASGAPHVRCPLPSPIRPSKRPLPIHSTRCHGATCHGASKLHYSSTPGQLPDRPVGLGRRVDASIGPTACPRPIAVADSPIEAANPR